MIAFVTDEDACLSCEGDIGRGQRRECPLDGLSRHEKSYFA